MARVWYKRYPSNFISGCIMLTAEEKGVYAVLLDMMYDRSGPIPDEPRDLGRVCGCSTRRFKQVRDKLAKVGKIILFDGHISNSRFEKQVREEEVEYQNLRENAIKSRKKERENSIKKQEKTLEKNTDSNENNDIEEKGLQQSRAGPRNQNKKRKIPKEKKDELILAFRRSTALVFGGEGVPPFFPNTTDLWVAEKMAESGIPPDKLEKAVRSAQEGRNRAGSTAINSLRYFEYLLEEQRQSPPDIWEVRMDTYSKIGFWESSWGPKPDEDGCEVPEEFLRRQA